MMPENQIRIGTAAEQRAHINDLRAHGQPVTPQQLDELAQQEQREADNAVFKAERESQSAAAQTAEQKAQLERQAAAQKAEALDAYRLAGGTAEAFERVWPELRGKIIEQQTLDILAARRARGGRHEAGAF
jgi:hypothetical protein